MSLANHVAATKCMKACKHGEEANLLLRSNIRMRKQFDLSVIDCGMIVGEKQNKQPLKSSNVSKYALLMREVRVE